MRRVSAVLVLGAALAGGRPAMICGATGAIAAVVGDLVYAHGIEYLFWAVIVMGALQLTLGVLRADKLVRLIPHPVMIGFCNGLAIVIGLAQFSLFKRADHGGDEQPHQAARRLPGLVLMPEEVHSRHSPSNSNSATPARRAQNTPPPQSWKSSRRRRR